MQLELGRHAFDVTTRTLVIADVGRDGTATEIAAIVDHRPAIIAVRDVVQVAAARAVFDGPVMIWSSNAAVVEECLRGGADLAHDPHGFSDPDYLRVVEEADAAIVVSCPDPTGDIVAFLTERAGWAMASGIAKESIILDATGASEEERTRLGAVGCSLMITTTTEPEAAGLHVLHAMDGIRVIAAVDVRAARRTVDTVAELLERRTVDA